MKIRKNKQITLLNPKGAGRKAVHDKSIRHIRRERILKPTSMHLTIKVRENKADIKSKSILKALHHAIIRARLKGIRVIHYTLEYNHVHLLVEAHCHTVMHRGMQAFGISFSKAINKIKQCGGTVYKHRHHIKKITSALQLKNVLTYIFHNGVHHKRSTTLLDPFNSLPAESLLEIIYPHAGKRIKADIEKTNGFKQLALELKGVLDDGIVFFKGLAYVRK